MRFSNEMVTRARRQKQQMKQLIIALMLLVSGCETEKKPIPIAYNCPPIVLPKLPKSPTAKLTKNSKPDEIVKAYAAELDAKNAWIGIVIEQIDS